MALPRPHRSPYYSEVCLNQPLIPALYMVVALQEGMPEAKR